ncbi:MAG: FAD-dependent oxidoreductase, partial [Planctomycetota bacterium]|nr:FAD-dependent oxidoreductase [Planctomycetota bacterium]
RLLDNAAHYVAPLKTTIPLLSWFGGLLRSALIFAGFSIRPGSRGVVPVKFGLWFYDFVTRKDRKTPTHYLTSKADSLREIPGLHTGIAATATYWDAWITQTERLCIEMLQDAARTNPRSRALNYVSLEGIKKGAVLLKDLLSGQTLTVTPRIVVNATGAWVDLTNAILGLQTRYMGGTKGSHLVVDNSQLHQSLRDRMVYYQHDDGRVCIVFPFLDKVIMGSTDIRVDDPDKATCTNDEIEYMLTTLRSVFPGIQVQRDQIVFTFCGVRPLPAAGVGVTANISRGHSVRVIEADEDRQFPIYCLIGGKWTTFRAFAQQVGDTILARLTVKRKCDTVRLPIGGGKDFPSDAQKRAEWIKRVAGKSGLTEERIAVLLERYGTAAEEYATGANTEAERPLKTLPAYTVGEIERIASSEYVVHLADIVNRRSLIALLGDARKEALQELAEIAGNVLHWDDARKQQEAELAAPPGV